MKCLSGWRWFWSHCLPATKFDLMQFESIYMATQSEVVAELRTLKGQIDKIKQEVVAARVVLTEQIKKLEEIIAAGGTGDAIPALVEIKDELKAELQALDDLNVDTPVEPPPVA